MAEFDLKAIATKAVYDALSDEQKEELVTKTLDTMLKASTSNGSYRNDGPSLLETAVQDVLKREIVEQVRVYFESHQAQLQTVLGGVIDHLLDDEEMRELFVRAIANSMQQGLKSLRGY
jgi:hypothetical protein